jgi:hypothetical protein
MADRGAQACRAARRRKDDGAPPAIARMNNTSTPTALRRDNDILRQSDLGGRIRTTHLRACRSYGPITGTVVETVVLKSSSRKTFIFQSYFTGTPSASTLCVSGLARHKYADGDGLYLIVA